MMPPHLESPAMTEHEDPSHDRLKQHFAQRVTHQARHVVDIWLRLQHSEWNLSDMTELVEGSERLLRYAERFEQPEHSQLAAAISACLEAVENNRGRLSSALISELSRLMQRLAHTGLRHNDPQDQNFLPQLRKPIYLALNDDIRTQRLAQQLQFFGLQTLQLNDAAHFESTLAERHPAAILIDVDFSGAGQGLALAKGLQQKLPLLFFSETEPSPQTRLAAVRCGAEEFFTHSLDASTLLERLEVLTHVAQYDPYKVLIVDDSRAQATHTERVLNSAGIITQVLTDPIQTMLVLSEFQPDLIILDMYMPECNGPELAKVIRHNDRYVSVPIIYLSAEDDLDKQLDALNEGGEDFLTKPIKPRHLIATVRNRVARARHLKARMVRDSLTGLYNHTHILQLLDDAAVRARHDGEPMSFAMLDIDHFKKVNDTHGHPMGDRVIKSLALFLKQRLRKTDFIGRYGGEEFAVVMPNTDAAVAATVLDGIRRRFAEIHYPTQTDTLFCTFSCGIAELSAQSETEQLPQQADQALYLAKHHGRNQVRRYAAEAVPLPEKATP
jgi:diguanylate cyclase (GGDEF)-like protein